MSNEEKRQRPTNEALERVYGEGYSLREIGLVYGVSGVTVRKWLLKAGVKMRSPGRAGSPDVAWVELARRVRVLKEVGVPLDSIVAAVRAAYGEGD